MRKKLFVLVVLLFPLFWMLPQLGKFFYATQSSYNDLTISHLPNALYLLDALTNWKTIPLWSDSILSGYPFAANPLSGLWYLPGWLALIFPQPFGFNLVVFLHLLWGGLGIYAWLNREGYSLPAALFGALAFEAMPKLFAHFYAGHVTLVYAISWTGWLLFSENFRLREGTRTAWIYPGLVWGMILLADIRWAAYAGMIWLGYSLFLSIIHPEMKIRIASFATLKSMSVKLWTWAWGFFAAFSIGTVIAAPLLVPLMGYISLSTRRLMGASDNLALSLPPANLFGLFFPPMGGNAEWVLYPGIVSWVLLLLMLPNPTRKNWRWFWVLVGLAMVLLGLGVNLPFARILFSLPGFSLLRVPPRAFFILGLAFSALGAESLQTIIGRVEQKQPLHHVFVVILLSFLTILTLAMVFMLDVVSPAFVWTVLLAWVSGLVVYLYKTGKIKSQLFSSFIFGLLVLDLAGSNIFGVKFLSREIVMGEKKEVAGWLASQSGLFRVYSPSYSLPQQSAALYHLQLADGVDPMQLSSYRLFMEKASGIPFGGYSVTLPPFASGEPDVDNQGYAPDADLLGYLNVRYVVSEYALPESSGLVLQEEIAGSWIYENKYFRPRAWVQPSGENTTRDIHPVTALSRKPNRLELQAEGPGLLVFSEIAYPGWEVWVDGERQPVGLFLHLFRSVELGEGNHSVSLTYQPASVYWGVGLGVTGWCLLGSLLAVRLKKRNHSKRGSDAIQ